MKALVDRLKANFSLLSLVTPEETRAEMILARVAIETKRSLFQWSITLGLRKFSADGSWAKVTAPEPNPMIAAKALAGGEVTADCEIERAIVVFLDISPYLKDPVLVRAFRDALASAKANAVTGIFLGPSLDLPAELRREVADVELPLPDAAELANVIEATCDANKLKAPHGDAHARLVDSARGLTTVEAENALALSLVATKSLDPAIVSAEKARSVKAAGALEILKPPSGGLDAVGGLEAVKDWVRTRGKAFSPEAKAYGLPNPKGALLVGVQGCGKSLASKCAAASLGLPLIRLDLSALMGSLVGESESNMRAALKTIDAVAPCVLVIDEMEKGFAGSAAGKSTDSGTASRVLGHFLTWTQEHESPVFVIATANDVTSLPPELLRRGRWDTLMFVDLPDATERAEIFRIHIEARKRNASKFKTNALAELAAGFSGAEIEQAITDAMFEAFARGEEVTTADIQQAVAATVPLSRTMAEPIANLREWAKTRCVPANGRVAAQTKTAAGRKVIA